MIRHMGRDQIHWFAENWARKESESKSGERWTWRLFTACLPGSVTNSKWPPKKWDSAFSWLQRMIQRHKNQVQISRITQVSESVYLFLQLLLQNLEKSFRSPSPSSLVQLQYVGIFLVNICWLLFFPPLWLVIIAKYKVNAGDNCMQLVVKGRFKDQPGSQLAWWCKGGRWEDS